MSVLNDSIRHIAYLFVVVSFLGCTRQPAENASTDDSGAVNSESSEEPQEEMTFTDEDSAGQTVDNPQDESEGDKPAFDGESYALLVGCTTYDHLGEDAALQGPVNDVQMMRDLLRKQFGFADENIRRLTEERETTDRPTKANIVRELNNLTKSVKKGDRVVILLSGHGSQQPDNDPDNEDDPEPDGLDEIFCPADLRHPESTRDPYAINALTDDELRENIGSIRKNGAFVWVIVDACHSGSAVRGTEVYRQLSPERLFPKEVLANARRQVKTNTRSVKTSADSFDSDGGEGGLVAIYAAQPHEPTLEMMLPHESDDSEWRGLLTYTLIKVLTSAKTSLTYKELVQRIHSEYIHSYGRLGPTPLIEGVDQHREVLGQSESSSATHLSLTVNESGKYVVNAGQLHGYSRGTVFAAYPPPGEKRTDAPLGHVMIVRSQLTESTVVPVEHDGAAAGRELPIGALLEAVEIKLTRLSLKVAVHDQTERMQNSKLAASLPDLLRTIESEPGRRIEYVDSPSNADWIVRCTQAEEVYLLPAEGWTSESRTTHFGPAPSADLEEWLQERLGRISRIKALLKLCDASKQQSVGGLFSFLQNAKPCEVELEMHEVSAATGEATKVDWTKRNWTLNDGEQLVLQIENTGRESVDFSVLFIDSEFGITPLFPAIGTVVDNRLQPGQNYAVGPLEVEASTLGLEHLVVIATKAQGQPVDFSWLGQESLETVAAETRGGNSEHPLSEVFRDTLYADQRVRGMRMTDAESTCLRAVSWKTTTEN